MNKNYFIVILLGVILASCSNIYGKRINRHNSNPEQAINTQANSISTNVGNRTSAVNQEGHRRK